MGWGVSAIKRLQQLKLSNCSIIWLLCTILGALWVLSGDIYMASENRSKYWVFTLNTEEEHDLINSQDHQDLRDASGYFVYQLERGQGGNRHYQGYIELLQRKRLSEVRHLLNGAHFEVRRGSQHQAIEYAKKDDTRVAGPWEYGLPAVSQQGQRTDLTRLVRNIKEGKSLLQIVEEEPQFLRFASHIKSLQSELPLQHRPNIRFVWMYGDSGGGKTASAYEAVKRPLLGETSPPTLYLYDDAKTEWWQGYSSESVVLIDDFQGLMEPSRLMRLLDRYEYRVPTKGSSRAMSTDKIIITSHARFDTFETLRWRTPELRRRFRDFGMEIHIDPSGRCKVSRGDPLVDQGRDAELVDIPLYIKQWLFYGDFDPNMVESCRDQ